MCVFSTSLIKSLNPSAMAVESVTVVAPEVRVGPFILSKGTWHKHTTYRKTDAVLFVTLFRFSSWVISCLFWSSTGLVEQINNFQTLNLRDFTAFDLDPFLSIDDDYFYHTQYPRRPEVSVVMWTPTCINIWPLMCCVLHIGTVMEFRFYLFVCFSFVCFSWGRGCACEILLCWTKRWDVSPRPGSNGECCRWCNAQVSRAQTDFSNYLMYNGMKCKKIL